MLGNSNSLISHCNDNWTCEPTIRFDSFSLGANTTTASIVHAVLDFLHDRRLMEKIQREIDDNFAPEDKITHVEV